MALKKKHSKYQAMVIGYGKVNPEFRSENNTISRRFMSSVWRNRRNA